MSNFIVSDIGENALTCELCKGCKVLSVKEFDKEGHILDSWWRCLKCKKDYGCQVKFYKNSDNLTKIQLEVNWRKTN